MDRSTPEPEPRPGLPLYVRAVLPSIPVLRRLPGLRREPDAERAGIGLHRSGIRVDRDRLAAYSRLTGNRLGDTLPVLYPHLAAFDLQLRLLADRRFPFAPLGLVHVDHVVVVHRPVGAHEQLDVRCRAARLRPHRRGRLVDIDTAVTVGSEPVYDETMTLLSRGSGDRDAASESALDGVPAPVGQIWWDLPTDLGRRYAAVSGDRNPIHLHALAARAFGFPRALAHGMWTAGRALAAVATRLPLTYRCDVAFRRPVLLPGRVRLGTDFDDRTGTLSLGVVSADADQTHLVARMSPL